MCVDCSGVSAGSVRFCCLLPVGVEDVLVSSFAVLVLEPLCPGGSSRKKAGRVSLRPAHPRLSSG